MTDGPPATWDGYNAAAALLEGNLPARAAKVAIIDEAGPHTYADLARRAEQCGAVLRQLATQPGDRVILCMLDSFDLVACFLGAIMAGLVPVPLNTLLQADDYAHILADSGARLAVVSRPIVDKLANGAVRAGWAGRIVVSGADGSAPCELSELMKRAPQLEVVPASSDAPAFWLYSSGSTGRPKGVIHRHGSLAHTAEFYARQLLGVREDDVLFSAAKLFFAYGLGNALTFPLSAGATVVLLPGRATPEAVWPLLRQHRVTLFFGVPTLYASMLAHPEAETGAPCLRLCVSAGEALPAEVGRQWTERHDCEIIDGVGSTEMLHIFVTNRPGAVRYGSSGRATPGYELRLLAEGGREVAAGELGELHVRGPSAAVAYWNEPEKSAATFADGWVKTGDRFRRDEDGVYFYGGRADDMLKISGIWVSPAEVEAALVEHGAVLEAAVVGVADRNDLLRVKAYVVLKDGVTGDEALAEELRAYSKSRLAPYKYPRLIEFTPELPKTATGKVRRHVLRDRGR